MAERLDQIDGGSSNGEPVEVVREIHYVDDRPSPGRNIFNVKNIPGMGIFKFALFLAAPFLTIAIACGMCRMGCDFCVGGGCFSQPQSACVQEESSSGCSNK